MAAALSWPRRLGYGVGDIGFNLFFTTAGLFLLLYYTDVAGLSPSTAGWVFAAALAWDAVTDPVMGYIASRTRSRWGRYRPWILFGAVPLAASWALIFLPVGFTGVALTIWALAAHMLFRTCYTIVGMPYVSLSAAMTSDSNERGILAAIRMMSATAAGLFIALLTLPLVARLGAGDDQRGFFLVALLYGAVSLLLLLVVFVSTREDPAATDAPLPSAADMVRMLRANRAFWLVSGALLMTSMASTFFQKALPYHLKYDGDRQALIGTVLAAIIGTAFLSIPLWTVIMRRTSKRIVWLSGSGFVIGGNILFFLAYGAGTPALLATAIVLGIGTGAGILAFWSMLPDTVEYGEWRTGVRAEGMVFGLVSFVQKAALGLGVGLLGESLGLLGYVANTAQTPETLEGIRLMMLWAPMMFTIASATIIYFYPLDRITHDRLVREIGDRQLQEALP